MYFHCCLLFLYMIILLFIYSNYGHLGCIHFGAVMNEAAHIVLYMFLVHVRMSVEYICSSGIAGLSVIPINIRFWKKQENSSYPLLDVFHMLRTVTFLPHEARSLLLLLGQHQEENKCFEAAGHGGLLSCFSPLEFSNFLLLCHLLSSDYKVCFHTWINLLLISSFGNIFHLPGICYVWKWTSIFSFANT